VIGTTISHYRIVEQLGGGGMGVVYKAEDLRLGRTVALKFLAPQLSQDADAVTRFRNEARAASALDHPGICTIHSIEEAPDGRLFIAMAFCEGETLKHRLESGPLPLADALRIARQAADALSQAHARGIVHRDIKPANLMLTPTGDVKIVDFGVAKLADAPAMTTTGAWVGTPAYMSPEQAASGVVDARTDLWALGAVLFEMLTGRPPFRGDNAPAIVSSILYDDPPPLDTLRPGTPSAVTGIVRRLLAKDRGARYATAAELSEDLRAVQHIASGDTVATFAPRRRPAWRPVAIAAGVSLVVAVAAIALWMRGQTAASDETRGAAAGDSQALTRIAVLPFQNLGSADDQYFAAGMTEEITSRLAGISRLGVPSSTTLNEYDRRGKSVRQMGTDLGVDYLVEGGVRWARGPDGSRVRITPKLIRVADDTTVWTFTYDATLSDVFKVQSDIAYQITGALRVALEGRERRALESRPTSDDEAYLLYLRGLTAFQHDTSDTAGQALARISLEQAVERDPKFALAWSWLARVCTAQYQTGAMRVPATREKASGAARQALALDPALPEAHIAQASLQLLDRDYEGARRELDAAASSTPNSSELLRQVAFVERRRGRWREAGAVLKRALTIDPAAARDLTIHYMNLRQYDEVHRYVQIARGATNLPMAVPEAWMQFAGHDDLGAARRALEPRLGSRDREDSRVRGELTLFEWYDGRYERALELTKGMDSAGGWMPPNFRYPAAIAAGYAYDSMGRREEARRQYVAALAQLAERRQATPDDYQVEAALGLAYAGLGQAENAVRHARKATELLSIERDAFEGTLYLFLLARVYARLGQHDAAFATLDTLFALPGFYSPNFVKRDPQFVTLRSDPRFGPRLAEWSKQTGDALLK
jgi:TolB-like protein